MGVAQTKISERTLGAPSNQGWDEFFKTASTAARPAQCLLTQLAPMRPRGNSQSRMCVLDLSWSSYFHDSLLTADDIFAPPSRFTTYDENNQAWNSVSRQSDL